MKLVLSMVNGPERGGRREIDGTSLVVGRGEDCGWTIADPERVLSKQHFRIDFREEQYVLTDTSTNGVFLNGAAAPLGRGKQAILKSGDRIGLGPVLLSVELQAPGVEEDPFLATLVTPAAEAPAPAVGDPFAADDPFGPPPTSSTFLPPTAGSSAIPDDLDLDLTPSMPESPFSPPPSPFAAPPPPAAAGIPDDWLGGPGPGPGAVPFQAPPGGEALIEPLWRLVRAASALEPASALAADPVARAASPTEAAAILDAPGGEQALRNLFGALQEVVLKHRER